ncbi:hypothetical protein BCR37DRAFT_407931 [Protomyces lactucae-debilis]|uniref:Uncharacterized protein n=1 Tax=Protomyces lactucae-debilis TaxID=2754530 RepID=A0A1Y2FQN8_PROLT|nr:uncharacterized protein BCR37DRAFT_407931 [Protomyces lactucae-debilis]ORY85015.1 hypothetical protein BCR37DRAFT_407931 [Protomyces lactucae-debilis]
MTFTFTLVSLLLLVIHLELQHAAAEAGRSDGQNSNHGLKKGVDSQSKKRGRGKKQLAKLGGSTSATTSTGLSPAVKGLDFFPHDAGNATRKCYNATFLIEYIGPLATDEAVCATEKPSKIKAFQDSMQRTQHEAYEAKQVRSFSRDVSQKTCIQSPRLDIKYFSKTSVISGSCAINCHCTILNYFERIKMPKLRYKGGHFELSPSKPKSYWSQVPALSGDPPEPTGKPALDCHYEDLFEKVGWVSQIIDPTTGTPLADSATGTPLTVKWQVGCDVSQQNLPCDKVEWGNFCFCERRLQPKKHHFVPGLCGEGPKPPKEFKGSKKSSSGAKLDTSRPAGSDQSSEHCLAPATRGVTPADNPAHADASSSGQAALAGNSAEPATADLRLDPNDWEEWIATMSNVEQNPTTGLPVDRNVLTMQSCINHGLFNHPGFEQPHADICVAPSHDVQRQGVWSKELMEIKMMISPATLITFRLSRPPLSNGRVSSPAADH